MAKKIAPSISTSNIDHLAKYYRQKEAYSLMPLRLVGTTPLLMHAWGAKALIAMIGKMTGHDVPRGNKDLTEEYKEAFYRNVEEEMVIPCRIVKRCMLNGALATKKAVTKGRPAVGGSTVKKAAKKVAKKAAESSAKKEAIRAITGRLPAKRSLSDHGFGGEMAEPSTSFPTSAERSV